MNFINKVILFFKKLFNKQDNTKLLDAPKENLKENNKNNFINSLKINMVEKNNKKKVETPICFGDGLGIQTKISY